MDKQSPKATHEVTTMSGNHVNAYESVGEAEAACKKKNADAIAMGISTRYDVKQMRPY